MRIRPNASRPVAWSSLIDRAPFSSSATLITTGSADSPEKGHPGSSSSNFHLEPEDCKAYMRIDGVPKKIERLGQAIEQRLDLDGGSSWRWPDLSREWHRATGDSYIVECHPVYQNGPGGLNGALCEVFKYAVKVNELQHSDRLSALQILHRKRLLGTFGEFMAWA